MLQRCKETATQKGKENNCTTQMGTCQMRHTPLEFSVLLNEIEGWFSAPLLDRCLKHPARRGVCIFRHSPILCFGLPSIRSMCFYASPHLPPICRLDLIYLL